MMQRRKLPLEEITEHVKKAQAQSTQKEQEKSTPKPKKKMVE